MPTISQLAGNWIADTDSYSLIAKKKVYKHAPLSLLLNKDSTFKMSNVPDFVLDDMQNYPHGTLHDASGKWQIVIEPQNKAALKLLFTPGDLFNGYTYITFFLYYKISKIIILKFIGDPDQGDQIIFVKESI